MRPEGKSREFANLFRSALREFGMRVQTRANRGSADGKIVETVKRLLQPLYVALQKTSPSAELLPESQRDGILQMGAANFDNVFEFLCLGLDRIMHVPDRGDQSVLDPLGCSDVHRRRERVVR